MFTNYQYFKSIAKLLNLSAAAEELHLSQPALTKYVDRLEEKLGVKLLNRSIKPLRLTEAGHIYLAYAENYERLGRSLTVDLSSFKQVQYHVVVGITTWRGAMLLPLVYNMFMVNHLSYNIEFKEAVGDTLLKLLEDRTVDFCVMNVSEQTDAMNIHSLPLDHEEIRIVLRHDHPLFERFPQYQNEMEAVDLGLLTRESFILLLPSQQFAKSTEKLLYDQGIFIKRTLRISSMSTALSLVCQSNFLTFYPHSERNAGLLDSSLTTRSVKGTKSKIPFALVVRRGTPLTPSVVPVMECFANIYEILGAGEQLRNLSM